MREEALKSAMENAERELQHVRTQLDESQKARTTVEANLHSKISECESIDEVGWSSLRHVFLLAISSTVVKT